MMKRWLTILTTLIILTSFPLPAAPAETTQYTLHNTEESLTAMVRSEGKQAVLKEEWYGSRFYMNTSSSINQLAIRPVNLTTYQEALYEVSFPTERFTQYHVYILPYMLQDYPGVQALTFKNNTTVVFANSWELTEKATHKLAAHELGHQVDFQLMTPGLWDKYKKIRELHDSKFDIYSKEHKNRPQEIFAEDFRIICGGSLAAEKPHENDELKDPQDVPGLKDFFADLTGGGSKLAVNKQEKLF